MRKLNFAILLLSILSELIVCILFAKGYISDVFPVIIIVALISGGIYCVFNAMRNWIKAIVFALILSLLAAGVGFFGISFGNSSIYTYTQIKNLQAIKGIKNNESYLLVMSYDGYDYYIDENYSYLYKIKENGIASYVSAHTIVIDREGENSFGISFGDFYKIDNNSKFENINKVNISLSFVKDQSDTSAFLKLISEDNKVFYTYFPIDNINKLVSDMDIIQSVFRARNINFYLTKPSKIIDGTDTDIGNGVSFVNGSQYIITAADKVFSSESAIIEFDSEFSYHDRINYYLNKDRLIAIENYERSIESLVPDSTDYIDIQTKIALLQSQLTAYTCELEYEQINDAYQIRMYKIHIPGEELSQNPNISVIEVYQDGKYLYAGTSLLIDDFQ